MVVQLPIGPVLRISLLVCSSNLFHAKNIQIIYLCWCLLINCIWIKIFQKHNLLWLTPDTGVFSCWLCAPLRKASKRLAVNYPAKIRRHSMLIYMEWMKSKVGYQHKNTWNALKNGLQQVKWATISTQPLVGAFNWIRLSLVGLVYCDVCVLIYCYCYVCRLDLLGFLSTPVIAARGCSWVSVTEVCVGFEVFDVTSLIKGHWESKCLSLPVIYSLSVLFCLKLLNTVCHNLRVLDWCEMCFFETCCLFVLYSIWVCVCVSLCFVLSFSPMTP